MSSAVIPTALATPNLASIQFVPLQLFSGEFLYLAVVFIVLAILAGLVGARGVAGVSMAAAKWFIILFIVLAIISLVL